MRSRGTSPGRRVALPTLAVVAALAGGHASGQPLRVGNEVPYRAESAHPYPTGDAAAPVWSVAIHHPGATYVSVHFERFELGPGDRVEIRSGPGAAGHVLAGRGRGGEGSFWAPHVKGDRALVELWSPQRHEGSWGASIDRYAAGTVDLEGEGAPGLESVCGADDRRNAICYRDDEPLAYLRSQAVARLLIQGTFLCTGWLVGCEGHLLTNRHCIGTQTAAANTDYEFLAETAACSDFNCPLCWRGAIWPGEASLVKADQALDYALIRLAGNPQEIYGAFALDDRDAVRDERIYIPQHPGGRAREIGLESTDRSDRSNFCEVYSTNETPCAGGAGDVGYFCDTEPGSSGSPVVAYADHRVIALHHCSPCPNRGVPISAVIEDLGALLPTCSLTPFPIFQQAGLAVDDSAWNANGSVDPGETVSLQVALRNLGSIEATGVRATLSTTTPEVTVVDPEATWPPIPIGDTAASLAPHLTLEVGGAAPCGTWVDLRLEVTSDQGGWSTALPLLLGSEPAPRVEPTSVDTPLAFPGNEPTVSSTLLVPDSFPLRDVQVAVDIIHPRIGDFWVEVTSPAGTTVRLHDRSGGSTANLQTTYDALTPPDGPGLMSDFDGEDVQGPWVLEIGVPGLSQTENGILSSWQLLAEGFPATPCPHPGCAVTAVLSAWPSSVCAGAATLLSGAASTRSGPACAAGSEYRFLLGAAVLRDWGPDPSLAWVPIASSQVTLRVRDPITGSEDGDESQVEVLPVPAPAVTQTPSPACLESGALSLEGPAGFVSYAWLDAGGDLAGTERTLMLDESACGLAFTLEVEDGNGCHGATSRVVACSPCSPAEVSPPGSPVPFRMGIDIAGTVEFGLLPRTGVAYHLYGAESVAAFLAGDWGHKVCDLESNPAGTWTDDGSGAARWTPADPGALAQGYWVVVAEDRALGLEGSYGSGSDGAPRPPDDGGAAQGGIGCP